MITAQIESLIQQAIQSVFQVNDIKPQVTYPDPQLGDFATNVAFQLAGRFKQSPQSIAEQLAESLSGDQISEATAIKGFINLKMTNSFWLQQLRRIKPSFFTPDVGSGRKVQVEFISANPTGPLTLGNARGGFVGDVLARVLQETGSKVTREYYFNDGGTQIRHLVGSVKAAAGLIPKDKEHYPGDYIEELAKDFETELKVKSDDELGRILTQAVLERWIKPALSKMGVVYDEWFREKQLIDDGSFDKLLTKLQQSNLLESKDNALWITSKKYGDRDNRVIKKANGDVTYLGTDIAYHLNIFQVRHFDSAVKVWGADHAGQVPSLKLTLQQLVPGKQLDFVLMQWVRLMKDGQEVKMSKRAGTYVTVDELIEEVGGDVARFFFLMRSVDTPMDFDLDLAKEESQKNPLFYVMYSYARACSILEQASSRKLAPISTLDSLTDQEVQLVRQMTQWPQLLTEIAADYGVHRLTFFGRQLAGLFHDLYESERIIDLDKAEASKRLYVIQQYKQFMERYFQVLGIAPQQRMGSGPAPRD